MGLEQRLVRCGSGHDDLEDTLPGIWVVPLRAQGNERIVEVDADFAAHSDHHCLPGHAGVPLLEMGDEISGDLLQARLGTHELLQGCPAPERLSGGGVLFVLGQLLHFLVQGGGVRGLQLQLCESALVVDGHRGAILDRLLDVVDMDIVAKDRLGVPVLGAYRGASEGDKGGLGQGGAQVVGKPLGGDQALGAIRVLALSELGGESVLGPVGFIADDHDVLPVREHREVLFLVLRRELLDGGEDDPARWSIRQFGAEVCPGLHSDRGFPQQVLGAREGLEELPIQVHAVRDHHHGRVVHLRRHHQLPR